MAEKTSVRRSIGTTANHEVQLLADMLAERIAAQDGGSEIALIARGVLMRIHDLSDIVFEALIQDEGEHEPIDSLQRKLGPV